jgi:hypothetical protein
MSTVDNLDLNVFETTIPVETMELINKAINITKSPKEVILKEYAVLFKSDMIQKDAAYQTEKDRHFVAGRYFYMDIVQRPPTKPYTVLPFGFEPIRLSKQTKIPQTSIIMAVPNGGVLEIRSGVARGTISSIVEKISLWHVYNNVELSSFGKGKDFGMDNRTKFENPVASKYIPDQLIEKLQIQEVTLNNMRQHLSKTTGQGDKQFVVRTDLRIIRGTVMNDPTIFDSGSGVINISDLTADFTRQTDDQGNPIQTRISVWAAPHFVKPLGKFSEVKAIGTLSLRKDTNEVTMNGVSILPIKIIPPEISDQPQGQQPVQGQPVIL